MDYFYDGQIRRYVTQFMRVFIGFKYRTGGETPEERHVPVMYGDMTRQVASIIRENSENKLITVPRISCYISDLEMDTSRLSDASFVSKVNLRERDFDVVDGERQYKQSQGGYYTVERLMPTPFTLGLKADIYTSNTDQKLQLLEQIMVLFNPSLEIQTTDNYIDWTSLSVLDLKGITFSSRSIPQGTESEIDVCSLSFSTPIWISPPAKVKKLGIVKTIIMNIFTEQGDLQDIDDIVYRQEKGNAETRSTIDGYGVLLLRNPVTGYFDCRLLDIGDTTVSDIDEVPAKLGKGINWNTLFELHGGYTGTSRIYFLQPTGYEITGTFAINEADENVLVVDIDPDTIPTNTTVSSTVSGIAARGTIDAIVDPFKFNPIKHWNGAANIPLGTRYLLLETIGSASNIDGAEGWKGADGSTSTSYLLRENSVVEWDGTKWATLLDPDTMANPTYLQNLRTGIQYKWDGEQWLKSFEGEYTVGYWRLDLDA